MAPLAAASLAQESEILVGHDSQGQIKVDVEFPLPFELPSSVYAGISGYATGELGLHSTLFDDPSNDLFQLSPSADFRLILLAQDPGMGIWTGTDYLGVGDSFYVGPPPFDTHPVWNITNGIPGTVYSVTLKLHDLNGIYPDSVPFVLSFTPAPAPQFTLQISTVDAAHALLLWTTNASGWQLESANSVSASSWTLVTNTLGVVDTNFSLSIDTTQVQRFFRLHLP